MPHANEPRPQTSRLRVFEHHPNGGLTKARVAADFRLGRPSVVPWVTCHGTDGLDGQKDSSGSSPGRSSAHRPARRLALGAEVVRAVHPSLPVHCGPVASPAWDFPPAGPHPRRGVAASTTLVHRTKRPDQIVYLGGKKLRHILDNEC